MNRRDYLIGSAATMLLHAVGAEAKVLVTDAARAHALVVSLGYDGLPIPLVNARNDGRLIASRLTQLKFGSVDHVVDPDEATFTQHLQAFVEALKPGDLAFVYYAGHGVQIAGVNYLLMRDGKTFISMQSMIEALRAATDTVILLLDACRTDPTKQLGVDAKAGAGRGIQTAEIERIGHGAFTLKALTVAGRTSRIGAFELQGTGIRIIFATDPQNSALDGATITDVNSPFAVAVAKRLLERRSLDDVMTLATGDVVAATEGDQSPWSQGSIGRPIYLAGPPENKNPATMPFQVPG